MIGNLQRIQIKIACDAPPAFKLDPFLEIFGRWRSEKEHPAQWVDLADYAHMSRGPGVVLVGHRCSLSMDLSPPVPGILYSARKGLSGSHAERIASAFEWCLELAQRLTGEKEFPASVRLRPDWIEIRFTDRLETPNEVGTAEELRPALRRVLDLLIAPGYDLIQQTDPAGYCGFSIRAKKAEPLEVLLERMARAART